jgi:hypothetical protein
MQDQTCPHQVHRPEDSDDGPAGAPAHVHRQLFMTCLQDFPCTASCTAVQSLFNMLAAFRRASPSRHVHDPGLAAEEDGLAADRWLAAKRDKNPQAGALKMSCIYFAEHLEAEVAGLLAEDTYLKWDKRWAGLKHTPSEFQHELVLTCMQELEDALEERKNTEHLRRNVRVWREVFERHAVRLDDDSYTELLSTQASSVHVAVVLVELARSLST